MEDGPKLYRSQLDYSLPLLDETLSSSDFQTYYPLNSCKDNSNPLQFDISGNSTHFVDLFNSFLYTKVVVKRQDGTKITDEIVAPANLFLQMLIKNCAVYLNNVLVSDSSNNYSYAAWISTHLALSQGEKTTQLTSQLYYKDIDPDLNDPQNDSFKKRQEFAKNSQIFEVLGKIHTGLFYQKRYLPPNSNLKIVLTRNSPEFALSSNSDSITGFSGCPFIIGLEECILYIRKHQLSPTVANTILRQNTTFNFPHRRSEIRSIGLPIGSFGCSGEILFNQRLPELVLIGLVSSEAYGGKLTKSATNFLPYNVNSIGLTINDVTYRSFKLDYNNGIYLLAFRTLLNAQEHTALGNYIDRSDYKKGSCLYMFDLRPSVYGTFQPEQSGQVKLDLQFPNPLTQSLTVVAYGQFQSLVQIENNGGVSYQ